MIYVSQSQLVLVTKMMYIHFSMHSCLHESDQSGWMPPISYYLADVENPTKIRSVVGILYHFVLSHFHILHPGLLG